MKPAHCAACDTLRWRVAVQQVDRNDATAGQVIGLWPKPDTVFASFATETGMTSPIAFCPSCAPALGDLAPGVITAGGEPVETGGCVSLTAAKQRHDVCFTTEHGEWLRAHLCDQIGLSASERDAIMEQWAKDRDYAPEVKSAGVTESDVGRAAD